MAIDEGALTEPLRPKVAWLDALVPQAAAEALARRGFVAESCRAGKLGDDRYLQTVRAVVLTQAPDAPAAVRKAILTHAPRALDFGCNVVVRPAQGRYPGLVEVMGKTALGKVITTSAQEQPPPSIRIDDEKTSWERTAEFIDRRATGRPPDRQLRPQIEPKSDGTHISLTIAGEVLLQRAFADCERVYLRPLEGGRSGAIVLLAYPTLKQPYYPSRWPTPCCVKIATREESFAEYKAHRERVDPYIPFHLGPHLIPERCFLGASEGIVVTDFVEESESLVDCARAGRAAAAIAGLFNRTLHGWHRDAKEKRSPLVKYLPTQNAMPGERWKLARRLSAKRSQETLQQLVDGCRPKRVLVGPIHGDLNAGNILVRGGDAIVIDFSKHREEGAVIYDAAALEASLLVAGFAKDHRDTESWLQSVSAAYERTALVSTPPYIDPDSRSYWFFECIRQIRRYARQVERGPEQYPAALGAALLKLACKDLQFGEREEGSRAAAYVLADRMLTEMLGERNGASPSRSRRPRRGE
jgi:hypothetical protein